MTDFRAVGTIMGPAGLTAVFGMGTGGTPPVWSPEKRPRGGSRRRGRGLWGGGSGQSPRAGGLVVGAPCPGGGSPAAGDQQGTPPGPARRPGGRRTRVGVVKSLGC